MLPNKFVRPDTRLELALNQMRNNGTLSFEISLMVDTSQYINGVNIIDALVLDQTDPESLYSQNTLEYRFGDLP